ncbi:hypothetical protein [Leptolyngbya sp. 'hensonii']|uniref:hypothetical protein n=1 Tax=Leptolyngbya sp. 'hensonii' TaxID=1922337 RepID=UPI0015C54DE8|nr:hypothetical protein [Leptolyngbya sp. 'hensonii']
MNPGLTKREFFACQIMTAWLNVILRDGGVSDKQVKIIARDSVAYADFLLEAIEEADE